MNNIDFFKKQNVAVSHFAEEVTVCNGRIEENLFNAKDVPDEFLIRFISQIGTAFGEGVDLNRLQQFSFQAADGIGYHEDKFMAVYSEGKTRAKDYNIRLFDPHDDYCINYFCDSKKRVVKFYDLHLEGYQIPALPPGSSFASPFGHGVSEGGERQDSYFCHNDLFGVANFFQLPPPTVPELDVVDRDLNVPKVFGVTFDSKTLKPLKLKRYFYPRDPLMKYVLFDEVTNDASK